MDIKIELKILAALDAIQGDINEIKDGQKETNQRLDRVETRLDSLENRMDSLEGRMNGLEGRMGKLEEKVDNLDGILLGVIHHQNEDYRLLNSVNEKVDRLVEVTQSHEDKLRLI
ncbi:MAG: hypothetical protein FWB98_09035 [Defluviitaleaceae bacterium]|nr:hypothetical protein [Defluviitaleaceae bacterium]